MKTNLSKPVLVIAIVAFLASVPAWAEPLGTHQLLRLHSVVYDFVEDKTWDDEVVLFRSGELFIRHEVDGSVRYHRLRMPEASLARLRQVLASERVGLRRAEGCKISISPNTANFRGTLTWYGKGNRTVHLEVNDPSVAEVCSSAVENLFLEVLIALPPLPTPEAAAGTQ